MSLRLIRTGLGIVVIYTAYSTYVQLRTSYEISERARRKLFESDLKATPDCWPSRQFGSMIVGGRFANPFAHYRAQTVFEFVYCRILELFHAKPRGGIPSDPTVIASLLPTREPDFDLLFHPNKSYPASNDDDKNNTNNDQGAIKFDPLPSVKDRLTLTWLGQSCAFVQMAGTNILTDPCLGEHLVSKYVGPKRISPAPCDIEDLPAINTVLVSHDHPDHLELETAEKIGNQASWVVPMGVGKHLKARGITNFTEMDWWEKIPMPNTDPAEGWEIACTPAMHWSGRKMIDSNTTLWCSFLVLRNGRPVFYHAGDTGYSPDLFTSIRKVFGSGLQVAMLPCGAYTPRWHLRPQHIDPAEAMQVMKELEARKMVGVHWGTFVLSDEYFLEPRDRLHELAKRANLEKDVIAPEFGRTLVFKLDWDTDASQTRPVGRQTAIREGFSLLME
uniref:ARAD1D17072p n=1 Tax=Blastobotrys adeninivorans TaxID=409370 RepID=A0A060TFT8_BLAAD